MTDTITDKVMTLLAYAIDSQEHSMAIYADSDHPISQEFYKLAEAKRNAYNLALEALRGNMIGLTIEAVAMGEINMINQGVNHD